MQVYRYLLTDLGGSLLFRVKLTNDERFHQLKWRPASPLTVGLPPTFNLFLRRVTRRWYNESAPSFPDVLINYERGGRKHLPQVARISSSHQ